MKGKTHKESAEIRENARAYKAEGHTMAEVALKFGISKGYAQRICKAIAPQVARPRVYKNQYTSGSFDRVANAKKYIDKCGGFEYAGNYTGIDGFVDLKCKTCGSIVRKSMVTVRHNRKLICPTCTANRSAERARKVAEESRKKQEERAEAKRQKMLSIHYAQIQMSTCECCGTLFVDKKRKKYCSDACLKRVLNSRHKDKRLKTINDRVVDRNISLQQLIKRDQGICWICGKPCDEHDYYINSDGVFISGNMYPSIDHIIPLAKGGVHSWDNVKLAHRICNILKGDSVMDCPPCA